MCVCVCVYESLVSVLFSALQQCKRLLGMCVPDVLLASGSCFNAFVHVCGCVLTCVDAHAVLSVREFYLYGMCRQGGVGRGHAQTQNRL